MGLQQGVVVNGVAGHEDQLAAHRGVDREVEIARQPAKAAHLQRRIEARFRPLGESAQQQKQPGSRHGRFRGQFAVARALVVVDHAGLAGQDQGFVVFDHVPQVRAHRIPIVRRVGLLMRGHQAQGLGEHRRVEAQQASRVGIVKGRHGGERGATV